MRKTLLGLVLLISLCSVAYASEDGRTKHNGFVRELMVLDRGVLNVIGTPLEIIRTPIAEWDTHHWLFPITSIPRTLTNAVIRASSAGNDIIVSPFVVPFTDDISPLTESFDLPEYVWSRA